MTASPAPNPEIREDDVEATENELQAVVATLPIPVPWDLRVFVDRLSAQRARPIELRPLVTNGGPDMPTGLWVPTADADHIFFEPATSVPHQEHIICHELGHMILRHEPDPTRPGQARSRRIFEFLDPDLALAGRERTSYTRTAERDAERLATMILNHAKARPSATATAWDDTLGFAT